MKQRSNISILEQERKSRDPLETITYEDDFDEIVKIINRKQSTAAVTATTSTTIDKTPIRTRYNFKIEDPEDSKVDLDPNEFEIEKPTQKPDRQKVKINRNKFVIPPEEQLSTPGYNNIITNPEIIFGQKFDAKSYKIHQGKENETDAYYVSYKYKKNNSEVPIGALINIQNKGYLIIPGAFYEKSKTPPNNIPTEISKLQNVRGAVYENDFEEAIEKLFAISKYKMPSTQGVAPPYTTDKPPSFKDAPEIETKEEPAVPDSEADTPENPEEKEASTPTSVETIVNKTETEEQRTSSIDSQMMEKFVKKYNNRKVSETDKISINSDLSKILNTKDPEVFIDYNQSKMSTIEDVAAIAAMIRVETGGKMENSPLGLAAVASWRLNTQRYGSKMSQVVAGRGHTKNKNGEWVERKDRKGGNVWNPSDTYTTKWKSNFTTMKKILTVESYKKLLEDSGTKVLTAEQKSNILKMKEDLKDLYEEKNSRILGYYMRSINLAIDFYNNKNSITSKDYKDVEAFIHPGGMISLSPGERADKYIEEIKDDRDKFSEKQEARAKKQIKNLRNSGNKFPYDFTEEKMYELQNPGVKDKEKLIKDNAKTYKIPNNKKTHGLRYVPFWVKNAIIDNRAFYTNGEAALFIRTKSKK